MSVLLEDAGMRLSSLSGRIYLMDVFQNLSRAVMGTALQTIWATPGWRQPWGFVIIMEDSATYDGDVRRHEMPPDDKRAVGTNIVTKKPVQRMVIKSIGLGLGLLSRFQLQASATLDEAVAAQLDLIKRAEGRNRLY